MLNENVATLIHDLKNPINAQEMVLDLLLQNVFGELNETQVEIIAQVKESCKYLKNIVYQAMENYRSKSMQLNINLEQFNFAELVETVVEDMQPLAKEQLKTLEIKCSNEIINADKFQMKRVISNLLGNAITYSIKNTKIEIISKQIDKNFVFKIKNKALPIKNIERVFEKFESTSNSGLGLYGVKQIIEAHKGTVFAKEEGMDEYSFGFVMSNF